MHRIALALPCIEVRVSPSLSIGSGESEAFFNFLTELGVPSELQTALSDSSSSSCRLCLLVYKRRRSPLDCVELCTSAKP